MGAIKMNELLELVKTSQAHATNDIAKNFTQPGSATAGIQGYDLEAPSRKLYPVLCPLRNTIPRVGGGFSSQANWRAITGINTTRVRAGVSEGQRGAQTQHSSAEYFAAYRGIGLEKSVSFEADYAAQGFEDVKALAVAQTLEGLMIEEEMLLLGGNTSNMLGVTPTPTLSASTSGGALGAQTLSVICVALGLQSYWDVAGINNGQSGGAFNAANAQIRTQIVRTNADGSTDTVGAGTAQKSAAASVAVSGSNASVSASVTPVRGAVAYAWYWGAAGTEVLGAVTTINSIVINSPATGTQTAASLPAADFSTSSLEFDGLLTIASKSNLGGYYNTFSTGTPGVGTSLTAGSGRVVEIDAALANFYDKYRLQPDKIYLNLRQFKKITDLVLGSANPNVMFTVDSATAVDVVAGRNVGKYLSPITGEVLDLIVHPNLPSGTILFRTTRVPAYLDGVQDMCRVRTRRDYYQIEWPLRTRKYEYGVYADEVLQHYFPPSLGVITNIGG
ncbi:hypothetical protein [Uliginosibacterium gangwonense]|uniref:hypothetical protein n=1 Tax=Uliginosibacterium gangwonense TaxID=392736 RepID=UPI0003640E6C|nr:hypothetical protein [Uliginosibacterium gangwonense]